MDSGSIAVDKIAKGKHPKPIKWQLNENGCHICISHTKDKGYPVIRRDGKHVYIMRYLYLKKHGSIPKGMVIRHSCDTPACINIDHLSIGTISENINDRHERGRDAKNVGITNGNSSLNENQVREVKENAHLSATYFANKFGVNLTTITSIKKGKTWQHFIV